MVDLDPFEGAVVEHRPGATHDLLGGLEHEDDAACELVLAAEQRLGHAEQDGRVAVVAAGVHLAGVLAGVGEGVELGHRQRVDVGAQADGAAALAAVGAASAGASIVKVGLYGPSNPEEAFLLLEVTAGALRNSFPETVLVAGAYADASRFGGIDPLAVPECATRAGAAGCLLDTFDKSPGHPLPDILPLDAIEFFIRSCRKNGLFSALAGSLGTTETALLLPLRPDYLGYRGALCDNGRISRLSGEKVRQISLAITEGSR